MNIEEIKHLAKLSSLELDPEQTQKISKELETIFSLVDQLQAVPTEGVQPLFHPIAIIAELNQPLRQDKVTESDHRTENIACAPAAHEGLYLVPKVIE
jgi:aspartyl-tRNA(Asn)/glutamyl-tRNA(Gln) amidotransferase subunit C